jgi:hypothetical protein
MGWEHRQGSGPYYYTSLRVNGEPRKHYIGTGPGAEERARHDTLKRQERQTEREARHAEQARVAVADSVLAEFRGLTALLVRATLLLAGLHEHHGEWRGRNHDSTSQGRSGQTGSPRSTAHGRPN